MSTRIAPTTIGTRKQPRQARSRATVEAIVTAAARVLAEQGWADFTTNKVADAAGVSIGSLYQYFPDKLALVDAIRRRHFDDVLAIVRRIGSTPKPLEAFIEELVAGMIAVHDLDPALHGVLLDEVPAYDGSRASAAEFEREYLALYAQAVAACHVDRPGVSVEVVARVLSSAVEGVIHNCARRGELHSGALRGELSQLISGYLQERG
ncbi:MAG: TetR/AcrR family transcriptional regulator [Devosia sp.]|nr:TetR/AcrR family transcriptional regulator [Devosia sp.]